MTRKSMTGNEAVAYAMLQVNPDVVAAYPITPQTSLMQKFADYVADGMVDTELVTTDSEHSAMSATVGASAAGARAMTATSSNGLAYMWEIVYIASSTRLPIVMPVVNRALSGPINIHCDHSDAMGARDSGWIQLFSENAQEAYENMIQAVRIAEHPDVLTPVMVCLDGFIISHGMETVEVFDTETVKKFIGTYTPQNPLLDVDNPTTYGPLDLFDYYYEHKRQQIEGMEKSRDVILDIGREFASICGKTYGHFEEYKTDDAESVILVLGSTAGTTKGVIDKMRAQGEKVGLIKLRTFRPFPHQELAGILGKFKAVAVLDRAASIGSLGGPLFTEVRCAMLGQDSVPIVNYIYGLGGRNIGMADIESVYQDLSEITASGQVKNLVTYLGVRE